MATLPEQIKQWLRESKQQGRTAYGFFAEYLYAVTMKKNKYDIQSVHSGGVDFLIDGKINVDVKSRICLGSDLQIFRKEPKSKQWPGIAYPHVIFYDKTTVICDADDKMELTWDEVCSIYEDYKRPKKRSVYLPKNTELLKKNREVLDDLVVWIDNNWKLKAKPVRRSSRYAMASMNKNGWGPEAFYFYPNDKKIGIQMVVLVYFEGETDYEVCAYPQELHHEIEWEPKKVGKNLDNRMTFKPTDLHKKFRFKDINEFKREFPKRFLNNTDLLS